MSDRERAREIVERLAYDEELDRNGQEALIAAALAQARAEGQEAMTVAEIERIIETTEPREMSSNGDRVWTRRMAEALHATVGRTIANEALRRAAEVAEQRYAIHGKMLQTVRARNYEHAGNRIAAAIRDLIKEPGHE